MRLIRPHWLAHADDNRTFEVYSLDASSDGKRVVTGGLDSKVKVWYSSAIASPEAQGPKLLASMAAHTGAVTAVKFSPDSRYIASGSDDRIVLISELDATRQPRREFGSKTQDSETAESEVWTPRKRLVGHDNDIQDLAWSPDGQLLVSVGLDSAIIVWSGTTFEKLKRLDWHNSHVKGVAFDPANKFFVTCSDDRSARIVRYSRASPTELSFSVEAVVQHAFIDSPLTSYFRRCSWSPDGECIACPNATNGPIPTVAIIDRGQWTVPQRHQISLVGHEGTTEVAKFSPLQYALSNIGSGEFGDGCVVATAGEDGAVAVWSTTSPRPIIVVQNVATKLITDLAWSPSGRKLYASSLDGSVVLIEFGKSDLGNIVPLEVTQTRLEKFGNATDLMDIPQSVEQLGVTRAIKPAETPKSAAAPVHVAAPTLQPTNNATQELTNEIATVPATQLAPEPTALSTTGTTTTDVNTLPVRQRTSVTKDGRKRVAPMLLNSTGPALTPAPLTPTRSNVIYDRPSSALPAGGISSLVIGNKRRADEDLVGTKRQKDDAIYLKPVVLNPSTTVSQVRLATPRVVSHLSSDTEASAVLEARNGARAGDPARLQVVRRGNVVFTDFIPEYVSLLTGAAEQFWAVATDTGVLYVYSPQGSRALPPLVLGAPVSLLSASSQHLCALTATGLVFAWNIAERKALFPPQSVAPCLDVGSKLQDPTATSGDTATTTTTSSSTTSTTNSTTSTTTPTLPHPPTNNGLHRAPQVVQCRVTSEGELLLATSTGAVFHFDTQLLVWQRISEGFWAYGSRFWDSTLGSASGPLAQAELLTNEEALLRAGARGRQLQRQAANRSVQAGFQGFERCVSLSHLSNRVVSAQALKSNAEIPKATEQYVRKLAENGDRHKLGEVLAKLQGPLLEKALDTAAAFKGVQALVAEYRNAA